MLRRNVLLAALVAVVSVSTSKAAAALASPKCHLIDQSIGTGGFGFGIGSTPMGAQRPFGAVRPGPDTCSFDDIAVRWRHFGGYYYGDSHIRCFSHTHMVGAGVEDLGAVGVMPVRASGVEQISELVKVENYRSDFSHDHESNRCGYYQVDLLTHDITVELAATTHVAMHRYTFKSNSGSNSYIFFPVSHSMSSKACGGAQVSVDPDTQQITGFVTLKGSLSGRLPGGLTTYFAARVLPVKGQRAMSFSSSSSGVWIDDKVSLGMTNAASNSTQNMGAFVGLTGASGESVVELAVAISYLSIDQALLNLQTELKASHALDAPSAFTAVSVSSTNEWEGIFGQIEAFGGSTNDQTKFYTAMYHAHLAPSTWSEAGNVYNGWDHRPRSLNATSSGYANMTAFYTDMSIWDIHRTQMPLLAFTQPNVLLDSVRSLLLADKQGGDIPRWPLANGYTGCMIGQHANVIIADAVAKQVCTESNVDLNAAVDAMIIGATTPRPHAGICCVTEWMKYGFVPDDCSDGCASRGASETLAFSYDAAAIASVAAKIGRTAQAKEFATRSMNYKNVWDPEYKFFCPKSTSGKWNCPDTWLNIFDKRYVEGDAWHWRWFVPHDIEGLISLFPSKEAFASQLSEFFYRAQEINENFLPNPYYWAGNEPDILAVWMFNYAGRADLTQKYSRWLLEHEYLTTADGLPGNDDYGTMSAWFVFASSGLYPLAGTDLYFLGSPLFDRVQIASTNTTVIAHDNSPQNIYVQKYVLNGREIGEPWMVRHHDLHGSTIEMFMTSTA